MAEGKSLYGSKPEDVFKGRYARRYRSELGVITGEIAQLNVFVYFARKIVEFRFGLFRLNLNHFWEYILDSLLDSAIGIIFKMVYDEGSDRLSLHAFAKEIKQNLAEERYRTEFSSKLRDADFKGKLDKFRDMIKTQRHSRIAHFNRDYNAEPAPTDWEDRKRIFQSIPAIIEIVNSFFDALCIHGYVAKMPFEYYEGRTPPPGSDDRPDIDILLDWVAKESTLLNLPETHPEFWRDTRPGRKPEDIEELNRYRRKFNLPDA